jgi:hypothetical protein
MDDRKATALKFMTNLMKRHGRLGLMIVQCVWCSDRMEAFSYPSRSP